MTEFTGVGAHCRAENCNQHDYLPFKCDCCSGTFCLQHLGYGAHACSSAGDKDFRATVCPLCNKTVRFVDSQDPNEAWELHARTGCNPGDYVKNKPRKKRCPASGCREILGPTNTHRCGRCGKETCFTHRYTDSHSCLASANAANRRYAGGEPSSAAAAAAARRAESARPPSLREKAAARAAAMRSQESTARGTADRRRRSSAQAESQGGGLGAIAQRWPHAANGNASHRRQQDTSGWGAGGGERGGLEPCPQCGAAFGDVQSLVAHVEGHNSQGSQASRYHALRDGGSVSGGSGERCPMCHAYFADVALLVSHVEAAHPDGARSWSQTMSQGGKSCSIS